MAETLLGLVGDGYVLMAADQEASRSIIIYKSDEDKLVELDSTKLLGIVGPTGDRVHFSEYIQKNLHLYALRSGVSLSTHATAKFTRNELANALRQSPKQVNLLIGGVQEKDGAQLYYCDYLGSMHQVPFGAHGYAGHFAYSIFDRYYKKSMNLEEGIEVIRKVILELNTRFLLKPGTFKAKVVDKDGIRTVEI
jgi:20S proteasome subunit beta 4